MFKNPTLSFKFSTFALATALLFALLLAPSAGFASGQNKSATFQVASVWQAIVNFFGFGDDSQEQNSDTNSQDNVYSGEDIIASQDVDKQQTANQEDPGQLQSNQLVSSGNSNLACLPNKKRLTEPAIIIYSCPKGTSLTGSSFSAEGNSGLVKTTELKSTEYIDCETPGANSTQRFECDNSSFDPRIETFSIEPANPKQGETVNLTLKTNDMKKCILSNSDMSIRKVGTSINIQFVAKEHDTLRVTCIDKTDLTIRSNISY